jgi:hypothetical protein
MAAFASAARLLALLALALAAPRAARASQCFAEYQSFFTWFDDARTQQFSYDLRDLCTTGAGTAGPDLSWNTGPCAGKGCMNNYTIWFAIGGNLTRRCNPKWTHYMSGGSIFQTWGGIPDPALNPPRADPETGAVLPVDPNCEILAHTRPDFDLQDAANPATGGITLSFQALPDAVNDINSCPADVRASEATWAQVRSARASSARARARRHTRTRVQTLSLCEAHSRVRFSPPAARMATHGMGAMLSDVGRQISDTHPPLTLFFLNAQSRYGETKGPRYLTLFIDCDPYGSINMVTPYNMTETSTCHYSLFMRSKAACGIAGDAIAAGIAAQQAAVTQPARDFGFTMLGTLCASRSHVLPRVCARRACTHPSLTRPAFARLLNLRSAACVAGALRARRLCSDRGAHSRRRREEPAFCSTCAQRWQWRLRGSLRASVERKYPAARRHSRPPARCRLRAAGRPALGHDLGLEARQRVRHARSHCGVEREAPQLLVARLLRREQPVVGRPHAQRRVHEGRHDCARAQHARRDDARRSPAH